MSIQVLIEIMKLCTF